MTTRRAQPVRSGPCVPALRRVLVPMMAGALLAGCVERRLEITSDPPGALVWVNDAQLGRTPLESSFLFHGHYDVRVELEGYETLRASALAKAPFYEYPPLDLAAEAIPARLENVQRWHFVLEPVAESLLPRDQAEAALLDRAGAMRAELEATPAPDLPPLPRPGEESDAPSPDARPDSVIDDALPDE